MNEADRVLSLPGWDGPLPFNMYSGYLNGSNTTRLFYIYVEADEIAPADAAVTLWLNGGPGCSSLDGFWYEHGPFVLDRKGKLTLRPYRWNRLSNMLYVESPVGVGMSYSLDSNYVNDDDRTALENRNALQHFFSLFPALKSHRFFLSGESYAGIYVPTLAEAILDATEAGTWKGPSLVGIGVGNGCTGTASGICGYYFATECTGLYYEYKFLSGFSFFPSDLKAKIEKHCDWLACISPSSTGPVLSNICQGNVSEAMKLLSLINIYNVIGECTFDSCDGPVGNERVGRVGPRRNVAKLTDVVRQMQGVGAAAPTEFDDAIAQLTDVGPAECIDSVDASHYMNSHEVQKALHARDPGYCWAVCNHQKGWRYTSTRKNLPRDLYPRLVSRLKVVIYNGDMDACVPVTDNMAWTENMAKALNLGTKKAWHPWSYNSGNLTGEQVAGYAIEYDVSHLGKGSFEFKTIRGAGHMVPGDMPEPALELLRRLIEVPSANVSYADPQPAAVAMLGCSAPSAPASISPQVGLALVVLVFVLLGSIIFLYQEVRALRQRFTSGGSDSPSGHSDIQDNQIDVSERESTVHREEADNESGHDIILMKGQINSSGGIEMPSVGRL